MLVQVNATGEASKGGCDPAAVGELVERALNLNLNVSGLMTVGPTDGDIGGDAAGVRAGSDAHGRARVWPTCSMGMSHDLDIAVECGTTRVRIGTDVVRRATAVMVSTLLSTARRT